MAAIKGHVTMTQDCARTAQSTSGHCRQPQSASMYGGSALGNYTGPTHRWMHLMARCRYYTTSTLVPPTVGCT